MVPEKKQSLFKSFKFTRPGNTDGRLGQIAVGGGCWLLVAVGDGCLSVWGPD